MALGISLEIGSVDEQPTRPANGQGGGASTWASTRPGEAAPGDIGVLMSNVTIMADLFNAMQNIRSPRSGLGAAKVASF
jgi:hypothetical protein